jgi:hypothetical protein
LARRTPTTCVTGRRRAKRGGNRRAQLFGAPVDAEVRPHYSTSSSLLPRPARILALALSMRSRKRGSFSSL